MKIIMTIDFDEDDFLDTIGENINDCACEECLLDNENEIKDFVRNYAEEILKTQETLRQFCDDCMLTIYCPKNRVYFNFADLDLKTQNTIMGKIYPSMLENIDYYF